MRRRDPEPPKNPAKKRRKDSKDRPAGTAEIETGTPNKRVVIFQSKHGQKEAASSKGCFVVRPHEKVSSRADKLLSAMSFEEQMKLLQSDPTIPNSMLGRAVAQHTEEQGGVLAQVNELVNKGQIEVLAPKYEQKQVSEQEYERYKKEYVGILNEIAAKFQTFQFQTLEDAVFSFGKVFRSYVQSFGLGMKEYHHGKRTQTYYFECATASHHKKTKSSDEEDGGEGGCQRCKWKAWLKVENGLYMFGRIDNFMLHTPACLGRIPKMNKIEAQMMKHFKPKDFAELQSAGAILPWATPKSTKRAENSYKRKALRQFLDEVTQKFIAANGEVKQVQEVSNITLEMLGDVEDEFNDVAFLIKLLTAFKNSDNATVFAHFQTEANGIQVLSHVCLMGATQRIKMTTHSDCIFCDSMWKVEQGGANLLTVVVINEHNRPVLGASCFATQETKEAWTTFFNWIKSVVPSFNPLCVATDGASYIFDAFKNAMPDSTAKNMVCWWHRKTQNSKKVGIEQKIGRKILSLAFACDATEVQKLQDKITQMLGTVENQRMRNRLMKDFQKQLSTIPLNMTCFTAGTVANSFAETVNHQLRLKRLDSAATLCIGINAILSCDNELKIQEQRPEKPIRQKDPHHALFEEECIEQISNQVLSRVVSLAMASKNECKNRTYREARRCPSVGSSPSPDNHEKSNSKLQSPLATMWSGLCGVLATVTSQAACHAFTWLMWQPPQVKRFLFLCSASASQSKHEQRQQSALGFNSKAKNNNNNRHNEHNKQSVPLAIHWVVMASFNLEMQMLGNGKMLMTSRTITTSPRQRSFKRLVVLLLGIFLTSFRRLHTHAFP